LWIKIRKIIIDTDIGDDIDDALAVVLALKSPEIDLIGITTVYKETKLRAQLALKLLHMYGRSDIPVSVGTGMPLINKADCSAVPCQFEAVEEWFKDNCSLIASDFIIDKVRSNEDVTIVTIGALTNVAQAIIKEPELMKRAKLVIMGGIISIPFPEGNINTDPEAAKIVFESGIPIAMVGLDVTLKCSIDSKQVVAIDKASDIRLQFLSKLIALWKTKYLAPILKNWGMTINENNFDTSIPLHDPMAVGFLIDESLFKTKKAKILIETKGEYTRGVTVDSINVFTGQPNGYNADVCIDVDSERFVELFMNRILN
jgi:purine nucleosidase